MIKRRNMVQGMAITPLLATAGTLANASSLLASDGESFNLAALQDLENVQFLALGKSDSDTVRMDMELVEVLEYSSKLKQPGLEQFTAVFRSTHQAAPEGLYTVASKETGSGISGQIYLAPSKIREGDGHYYSTSVCAFRWA